MKIACAYGLVDLAQQEASEEVALAYDGQSLKFGPDYIIPKPFDPRLFERVPVAVVEAAMRTGVASRPIEDMDAYRRTLSKHVNRSGMFMQPVINAAANSGLKLVYSDAENETVIRAVQTVVDEAIARPILVGRPTALNEIIEDLGLRLVQSQSIQMRILR